MATGSVDPEDRARKRRKQSVRVMFRCLLRCSASVVAADACWGVKYFAGSRFGGGCVRTTLRVEVERNSVRDVK